MLERTMHLKKLKITVSLAASILALVHIFVPAVTVDIIGVALLLIALIPWLAPFLRSVELPGGWKFTFQELEDTTLRAKDAGLLSDINVETETKYSFQLIANDDPNLALAGLRIELERRLRDMAERADIGIRNQGLGRLMRELAKKEMLTKQQVSVLSDMIQLLNAAVHAERLDPRATKWTMETGPRLLESLDTMSAGSDG